MLLRLLRDPDMVWCRANPLRLRVPMPIASLSREQGGIDDAALRRPDAIRLIYAWDPEKLIGEAVGGYLLHRAIDCTNIEAVKELMASCPEFPFATDTVSFVSPARGTLTCSVPGRREGRSHRAARGGDGIKCGYFRTPDALAPGTGGCDRSGKVWVRVQ